MLGIYFLFRGVEEMRQHSFSGVTVGEQQSLGQRKGSMAFKDLSATTIAEQLTFLEYRMLRRIPVRITHFLFIFFLSCFFLEMVPYQGSLFGAGAWDFFWLLRAFPPQAAFMGNERKVEPNQFLTYSLFPLSRDNQ